LTLAPGENHENTYTTALTQTTTNTATATGVDQNGASVTATASATVAVIHPAITLTKTASPSTPQVAPATFTYTYTVTNTGDTTLSGVVIYDNTFGVTILGPVTLNPGDNAIGTYDNTYNAAGTYTNVAYTEGTDQLWTKVTAQATATVVVTPPALGTRTWGWWMNHTSFTEFVFDNKFGSDIQIDSGTSRARTINSYAILFGAFEANVAKMYYRYAWNNYMDNRSPIDSARISMLHQLLAAILNGATWGSGMNDPVTGLDLVTAANNAYSGDNREEIIRITGLLDNFNGSGENILVPTGFPGSGNATPAQSRKIADIAFWDGPL
jgi:hypothetical protein